MDNYILMYGIGSVVTLIFIGLMFIYCAINPKGEKFRFADIIGTLLSVVVWPIFWILLIASWINSLFTGGK